MELTSDIFTIYSQLAQRTQVWSLASASQKASTEKNVYVFPVPLETVISSILLFQETPDGYVIIPYTLLTPGTPFDDKKMAQVVVKKGALSYTGYLINLTDEMATITIKSGDNRTAEKVLRIRKYDTVETLANNISLRNYCLCINTSHAGSIMMTYLINNIEWKGNYTAILDLASSSIPLLRYNGEVKNLTSQVFTSTETYLVTGKVSQDLSRSERVYAANAMASVQRAPNNDSDNLTISALDEYTKYPVEGLRLEDKLSVDLFSKISLIARKIYINTLGQQSVDFGYRFKAPDFLPGGKVFVYTTGRNGNLLGSFLGTSNINESRENDEVDLALGSTTSIKVETQVQERNITEQESDMALEESSKEKLKLIDIKSKISNRNPEKVTLLLHHYIGTDYVLESTCTEQTQKNGILEYTLELEPNSEFEFNCQLKTGTRDH